MCTIFLPKISLTTDWPDREIMGTPREEELTAPSGEVAGCLGSVGKDWRGRLVPALSAIVPGLIFPRHILTGTDVWANASRDACAARSAYRPLCTRQFTLARHHKTMQVRRGCLIRPERIRCRGNTGAGRGGGRHCCHPCRIRRNMHRCAWARGLEAVCASSRSGAPVLWPRWSDLHPGDSRHVGWLRSRWR